MSKYSSLSREELERVALAAESSLSEAVKTEREACAKIAIHSIHDRRRASEMLASAPDGTAIEFKPAKRTLDQNAKMWACLSEISEAVDWYGQKLSSEDWKNIFTAALRQSRVVPGIDGISKVPLGLYTSNLSKAEFGDLLEIINAFAAEHGVILKDSE